jgi:hypothetical protein
MVSGRHREEVDLIIERERKNRVSSLGDAEN